MDSTELTMEVREIIEVTEATTLATIEATEAMEKLIVAVKTGRIVDIKEATEVGEIKNDILKERIRNLNYLVEEMKKIVINNKKNCKKQQFE